MAMQAKGSFNNVQNPFFVLGVADETTEERNTEIPERDEFNDGYRWGRDYWNDT